MHNTAHIREHARARETADKNRHDRDEMYRSDKTPLLKESATIKS